MYSKIVNPLTGRKVSIYGKIGREIIKNYLAQISYPNNCANRVTLAKKEATLTQRDSARAGSGHTANHLLVVKSDCMPGRASVVRMPFQTTGRVDSVSTSSHRTTDARILRAVFSSHASLSLARLPILFNLALLTLQLQLLFLQCGPITCDAGPRLLLLLHKIVAHKGGAEQRI